MDIQSKGGGALKVGVFWVVADCLPLVGGLSAGQPEENYHSGLISVLGSVVNCGQSTLWRQTVCRSFSVVNRVAGHRVQGVEAQLRTVRALGADSPPSQFLNLMASC